jgi:hypothetical protein
LQDAYSIGPEKSGKGAKANAKKRNKKNGFVK